MDLHNPVGGPTSPVAFTVFGSTYRHRLQSDKAQSDIWDWLVTLLGNGVKPPHQVFGTQQASLGKQESGVYKPLPLAAFRRRTPGLAHQTASPGEFLKVKTKSSANSLISHLG